MTNEEAQAQAGRHTDSPGSCPAHQVTPEMLARGNELLAQAKLAADRAMVLQQSLDAIDRLTEESWAEARKCRIAATRLMLGTEAGY